MTLREFNAATGDWIERESAEGEIAPLTKPETPPTADALAAAVDALVEQVAQGMLYKSAAHCATYVTSTVPQWAAEAQAFIAWRDAVWVAVYSIDPEQPPASIVAVLAALPVFVRPTP